MVSLVVALDVAVQVEIVQCRRVVLVCKAQTAIVPIGVNVQLNFATVDNLFKDKSYNFR